jgi:hypothetical protein
MHGTRRSFLAPLGLLLAACAPGGSDVPPGPEETLVDAGAPATPAPRLDAGRGRPGEGEIEERRDAGAGPAQPGSGADAAPAGQDARGAGPGADAGPRDARPPGAPEAGVAPDARPGADATPAPPAGDEPPAGWKPTIVAVGYGGVRIRSRDLGETWGDKAMLSVGGGDDQNLLRCVTYGRGLYVAGGWKLFVSRDGAAWAAATLPKGCNLMEAIAYGNGTFVATCGGRAYLSPDAATWSAGTSVHEVGHLRVYFGGGTFVATGDDKQVFESKDGKTWSRRADLVGASFCDGAWKSAAACGRGARGHGVWLDSQWKGKVLRSTDGAKWTTVYQDTTDNHVEWFAFGYSPP